MNGLNRNDLTKLGRLFRLSLHIKEEYDYLAASIGAAHARDAVELKYMNRAHGRYDNAFFFTLLASLSLLYLDRFPEGGLASGAVVADPATVFLNHGTSIEAVMYREKLRKAYTFEPVVLHLSKHLLCRTRDGLNFPYFDRLSKRQVREYRQRYGRAARRHYLAITARELLKNTEKGPVMVVVEEDAGDRFIAEQTSFAMAVTLVCRQKRLPCRICFCVGDQVDVMVPETTGPGNLSA